MLGEDHDLACRQLASKEATGSRAWISKKPPPRSDPDQRCRYLDGAPDRRGSSRGRHHIVLLEILVLAAVPEITPLVFHGSRFRKLVVAPEREAG